MKNILILYAEVMPYNVAAYRALVETRQDIQLDVLSWNADKKLTPYSAPAIERVNYQQENDFTLDGLINLYEEKKYSLIYICGRAENKYLDLALYVKKKSKETIVIGQTDEQYYGNFKQWVVKTLSWFLYRRYFDKMFVPGYFQYEYMRYIGFQKGEILIGAYTADILPFNQYYIAERVGRLSERKGLKLLFLGRLEKEKGILELLKNVAALNTLAGLNFSVKVIGNGSLLSQVQAYDFVEHFKFADQKAIIQHLQDVDFFILPSIYEPWGVVIHEMAAAGMPIICSEECGARSAMVINNYNGFTFSANNDAFLKDVLIKAINLSPKKTKEFERRSFELSKTVTPDVWGETISSFVS